MVVSRAILLALLLVASTSGAWAYARHLRHATVDRGVDLLAQIRRQGVGDLYGGASERWYVLEILGRTARQPIGWRIAMVAPRSDGTVHGFDLSVFPFSDGARRGSWERWSLNADATEGRYIAGALEVEAEQWIIARDTLIELADGVVTMEQTISNQVLHSRSDVPDNYVPEGALELVLALMLDQPDPTAMQLILNDQPPIDGRPDFQPLTMRHARLERSNRPVVDAAVQISVAGQNVEVVFLNQQGQIDSKRRQYGGAVLEETRSPTMAVQSLFQGATDLRDTVLAAVESQWQATSPDHAPADPPAETP
jgi:hypothetical protein